MKKILISLNLIGSEQRAVESSFTGKKLRYFSKEESDQLCGHLRQIAHSVCGVQQPITAVTMSYITRMLFHYYNGLTLADITEAFEMRAAGELGLIEHYGSFSAEFIGSVLKKYSALRNAALHRYKQKAERALPQPTNYVSNQQVYNSLIIWVKWQKKIPVIWLWDAAYQYLGESEKVKVKEGLTYEQKQGLVIKHLLEMFPELQTSSLQS